MKKWMIPLVAWACVANPVCAQDGIDISNLYPGFFDSPEVVGTLDNRRTIYQDLDQTTDGVTTPDGFTVRYLANSRAFTGEGCFVNRLINSVGVANAYVGMENVVDDDLTNVATIAKGVAAKVTVDPLITVRDSRNYYAKGTTAGFCVVASGSSVLSLNIIKAMAIGFYRDGELIKTVAVKEGQEASGLTLSLVNIGTQDGVMLLTAEAPDVFDEISLNMAGGVQLEVASDIMVKYAFAGAPARHIMNNDWTTGVINKEEHEGGISKYNKLTGRNLSLDYCEVMGSIPTSGGTYINFIEDPEEGALTELLLGIGSKGSAEFHMVDGNAEGEEVFPAGTEVGFDVRSGGLLALGAGNGSYIEFYGLDYESKLLGKREYVATERVILEAGVLDVNLAGGKEQWMSAVSTKPFSGAKLFMGEGLSVNLGVTTINYAYIKEPPTQTHRCDIAYSSDIYLARGTTSHQIDWSNPDNLPVQWELVEKPEGSSASLSADDGTLFSIDTKGVYVVRLHVLGEGHEDCGGIVKIHYDEYADTDIPGQEVCAEPLVNAPGENRFVVSDKVYDSSGSLLSISDIKDTENLVDNDINNCATYIGGLSIADNICITGVKCATTDDLISDGSEATRMGFIVEESVDGLNVKALEFLQIRCYYRGEEVYRHIVDESNTVSVQAIGTSKTTKMRYSIEVPAGHMVDEIQLWTSGVLKLNISNIKIFYPFVSEADSPCNSLLGCNGELVNVNASAVPLQAGAVNVAQFVNNVSYLVDDSYDTYMAVQNSVSVGNGVKVLVDLGRRVHTSNHVGIIIDERTLLAGIKAGDWLTVRLHDSARANAAVPASARAAADADPTVTDEFTNWNVADVKVAGSGDKRVLYFAPSASFDQIELEIAGIAGVADTQKFYGICTRGDADNNGVPDCMESYVDPTVSGIDMPALVDTSLTVTIHGNLVTASCPGASISRLLVYDLQGNAIDGADGMGLSEASMRLAPGIHIFEVVFTDGTARALKLSIR